MSQSTIRPAAVAGMFYPAAPETLRRVVYGFLEEARQRVPARAVPPKAVIAPHAGYLYSGTVAASAYARIAALRGRVTRVVLIGPCHRVAVHGLALPAAQAFDTPLGRVEVDIEACARVSRLPGVVTSAAAHAQDHALEVQLPFLQHALGRFTLVPLLVGAARPADVARVLEELWGGAETLVVISSTCRITFPTRPPCARTAAPSTPRSPWTARSTMSTPAAPPRSTACCRWRAARGSPPSLSTCAIRATPRGTSRAWSVTRPWPSSRATPQAWPPARTRPPPAAAKSGSKSVAFTYNDPVIFAEYAMDVADACHERGLKTVAVTAGYMHAAPRREFYAKLDAANVDLKAFTEDFYARHTASSLEPVKDTLRYLVHDTPVWTEITTLLIPTQNDSDDELRALCAWIARELGSHVPLHFTAFHPDYRMTDLPATPAATLARARRIGLEEGLDYVYTGNVHDSAGGTTSCRKCGTALVVRDWHRILEYKLTPGGHCRFCHAEVAGRFERFQGQFGPRRIPVRLART